MRDSVSSSASSSSRSSCMDNCARHHSSRRGSVLRFAIGAMMVCSCAAMARAQRGPAKPFVGPRTPDGHPDFQGNWSNATLTPLERPAGLPRALSPEQVARIEKVRSDTIEKLSKASDPNRPAPPKGGDGSTGAAGNVGGYNYFWIDA